MDHHFDEWMRIEPVIRQRAGFLEYEAIRVVALQGISELATGYGADTPSKCARGNDSPPPADQALSRYGGGLIR